MSESTFETGGPSQTDEAQPDQDQPGTDIPGDDVGVGIGVGEPNTFEPEEDPDAAPDPDSGPSTS